MPILHMMHCAFTSILFVTLTKYLELINIGIQYYSTMMSANDMETSTNVRIAPS